MAEHPIITRYKAGERDLSGADLRAALEKYGGHLPECLHGTSRQVGHLLVPNVCDCGLDQAREGGCR